MSIGEKIKRLREKKRMTQSELAGDHVSRNMLSLIENGRATPSVQTLEALAEKLKTTSAFLLADRGEETALLKHSSIKDIRIAFSGKNYHIAANLCQRLYEDGMGADDEVDLVLAESLLETAKESLLADRVREACALFDQAVYYAERTAYYADHILGAAWLYFEYMGLLSPSLVSETLEAETASAYATAARRDDAFCRYIQSYLGESSDEMITFSADPAYTRLLAAHIRAEKSMREGDFEKALGELTEILRGEDVLPGIVMYHVFADLEEGCRRVGNDRNAGLYQDLKVSQFEKLMS